MRIIDADSLMDDIKRDSKKAIDEGDKVGSFWLGYAAGLVIKQPTIQPEKAQLSKEGTTSDLISRQAAIDAVEKNACNTQRIMDAVNNLPPAQPEPRTGKWALGFDNRYMEKYYYCSRCGGRKYGEHEPLDYFCSNCGADMRGEKDG